MKTERKIALLIDGDNAQHNLIGEILAEASKQGQITIKRIYGDWSMRNMKGWKEKINKYAINPIQHFAFTKRKNSTDTALIIDAMDILHSKLVDGFCLVSSDSDFTGLANRIREEGTFVMGIGQEKTPEAFVKACELFTYTENLEPENEEETTPAAPAPKTKTKTTNTTKTTNSTKNRATKSSKKKPIPLELLKEAFRMTVQENERANLSDIGNAIRRLDSSFDTRTYGFALLSKLFKALPQHFELLYDNKTDAAVVKMKD